MNRRKSPVTAVVLAKNEERNIERCLRSVAWCDELVVVDDGSTDATRELAVRHGARVACREFDSFASQRNWVLDDGNVQHEWVLMLDADECVTDELRDGIDRAVIGCSDSVAAFALCRKTMFMERWLKYSDGFPVWIMRLVRRGRARFVDSGHGEVPVPAVNGIVERIREPMIHYPFSKGIGDWIQRHNRYSTREAEHEFTTGIGADWRSAFARDRSCRRKALRDLARRMPGRPVLRFAYQYFWKLGFLDGYAGLAFSSLMATYELFIVLKRRELALAAEKRTGAA